MNHVRPNGLRMNGLSRGMALTMTMTLSLLAGCHNGRSSDRYYGTAPVIRGTIVQHVTASGTLGAVVSVDVGSQVSGKIASLKVDFNSPVKKGEVIAEIDPSVYIAALSQAEGDLSSAEANVVLKGQNLERKKILAPQHAATQLDLDQAVAELAQGQASVRIKKAVVDSARANLGYCKITSPVDGIVISRKVDAGQTLVAAMTTPVLFTIAQDITKMHISAAVSEADIGVVKVGQTVDFGVDAYPNETFHGNLVQVRKAPTTTSNVVTYETIIEVANPDLKLFPGMTADVSILVAQGDKALLVPNAALRFLPPDDAVFDQAPPRQLERSQRLAYTVDASGTKLHPQVVSVGIGDGSVTEVLAGLKEGSNVVTATLTGEHGGDSARVGKPPAGGPPPS